MDTGRQKNIEKDKKRAEALIVKYKEYVRTYPFEISEKCFIDDMIYGIGIALDNKKYGSAQGYDKFKKFLIEHLTEEPEV